MQGVLLEDRGVVDVEGPDAGDLLQRLFTNDVLRLESGEARYAALLTPQGKIFVDFLVVAQKRDDDILYRLDCPRFLAVDLTRKLGLYRLRAKVTITDRSDAVGVAAFWPDRPTLDGLIYRDPRSEALGFRLLAPRNNFNSGSISSDPELFRQHRIAAGVPDGGVDFAYGETFPHEANLDRLHGLDFTKGCYVGQEVVSRVEHRGTARKRVTLVSFDGEPPSSGTEVLVGALAIGTMGSSMAGHGLAMLRTDRVAEAAAMGAAITAAGTRLMVNMI